MRKKKNRRENKRKSEKVKKYWQKITKIEIEKIIISCIIIL